jgi:hypothetical protein
LVEIDPSCTLRPDAETHGAFHLRHWRWLGFHGDCAAAATATNIDDDGRRTAPAAAPSHGVGVERCTHGDGAAATHDDGNGHRDGDRDGHRATASADCNGHRDGDGDRDGYASAAASSPDGDGHDSASARYDGASAAGHRGAAAEELASSRRR